MSKELQGKPVGVYSDTGAEPGGVKGTKSRKPFAPFSPIDTQKEGTEVGAITTEKFEFVEPGDRLVGYLVGRRQINMPDMPWLYEVENNEGDWSFWGTRLINGRMEEVPDGVILDITYKGERHGTTGGRDYKDFLIKYYDVPKGFDSTKWRAGLDKDGLRVVFFDMPTIHPDDDVSL